MTLQVAASMSDELIRPLVARRGPLSILLIAVACGALVGSAAGLLPARSAATVVVGVAVVLAGILVRPAAVLWAIVLLLPYAVGELFRVVNYVLPGLLIASWGLRLLGERRSPVGVPRPLLLWLLGYIAWLVFSGFFAAFPDRAVLAVFRYVVLGSVVVVLADTWGRRRVGEALVAYALLMVPVAVVGLITVAHIGVSGILFTNAAEPWRQHAIFSNPNLLGLVMAQGVVILTAVLMAPVPPAFLGGTRGRLISGTALLILLCALASSFSRASFVFAFVGTLPLLLIRRKSRQVVLIAAGLIVVFVVVNPFPAWTALLLRTDVGLSFRGDLWKAAWMMMMDHPVTGLGAGTAVFEAMRPYYLGSVTDRLLIRVQAGGAHNVFLQNGAELGIPGMLLVVGLFAVLLRRIPGALKAYLTGEWERGVAAVGVLGFLAHGMFEGSPIGTGRVSESLVFFLCAVVLLKQDAGVRK